MLTVHYHKPETTAVRVYYEAALMVTDSDMTNVAQSG